MDEDSTQVISQSENVTVQDNVFDQFMSACDQANTPNRALPNAATLTNGGGIK